MLTENYIKISFDITFKQSKLILVDNKKGDLIIRDLFKCSIYLSKKIYKEIEYLINMINKDNDNFIRFDFSHTKDGQKENFFLIKDNGFLIAPIFLSYLEKLKIFSINKNNIFDFYDNLINLLNTIKIIKQDH